MGYKEGPRTRISYAKIRAICYSNTDNRIIERFFSWEMLNDHHIALDAARRNEIEKANLRPGYELIDTERVQKVHL